MAIQKYDIRRPDSEGTGIGLAITKRLAELMGGAVGFRSTHGTGSEFWVEVPSHAARKISSAPPLFSGPARSRLVTQGPVTVLARTRRPAVVVFDINLPGMSGLDALRVLRRWPETRQIPVIALTAAASERDRRQGEAAGFHRYLTKPLKVSELDEALRSALQLAGT